MTKEELLQQVNAMSEAEFKSFLVDIVFGLQEVKEVIRDGVATSLENNRKYEQAMAELKDVIEPLTQVIYEYKEKRLAASLGLG